MNKLHIHFDRDNGTSLQAQIREALVTEILSQRLGPGDPLPSSRKLAKSLNISRNTVILAYQALIEDGYVETKQRSRYYVSLDAPVDALGDEFMPIHDNKDIIWKHRFVETRTKIPNSTSPKNWSQYRYPFIYGQIDRKLFAHTEWRECARQALGTKNFEIMTGDYGLWDDPLLVDYICTRILPRRGVIAKPENIVVTLGAQNALYILAQLFIKKSTHITIEDPCYPDFYFIAKKQSRNILPIRIDNYGLPITDDLDKTDIVYVTPSHQAPTTVTLPFDRRKELLNKASEHDFIIIEDDYEFEMSYLDLPTHALKSMDDEGRVLYVGSFSKSLFPGLRLGYLVVPTPVAKEARNLRHQILRAPPGLTQRTTAYFLALGHHAAQIKRMHKTFAIRRELMLSAMAQFGLDDRQAASFGGSNFWVRGPDNLNAKILKKQLVTQGVLIEAGEEFFISKDAPKNYMHLSYASISDDKITKGIEIIAHNIEAMTK